MLCEEKMKTISLFAKIRPYFKEFNLKWISITFVNKKGEEMGVRVTENYVYKKNSCILMHNSVS